STSSPPPIFSCTREVIIEFVPLTKVRQRFAPMVAAHFSSNSETTLARDHTPLRMTDSKRFSSLSGIHIGHFCQPFVRTGEPPRIAGVSARERPPARTEGDSPMPAAAPRPNIEFRLINERLEYSIFDMIIAFYSLLCSVRTRM